MGTPAPNFTEGAACSQCWGLNKPFGNEGTPEYVHCEIQGTVKSSAWVAGDGEPMQGFFTLVQNPSFPCQYQYVSGNSSVTLGFDSSFTLFNAVNEENVFTFAVASPDLCSKNLSDENAIKFEGGEAIITIPSGAL